MTAIDFVKFAIERNLKRDPQWALLYLRAFWHELPARKRKKWLRKLVKNRYQGPTYIELERLKQFIELFY